MLKTLDCHTYESTLLSISSVYSTTPQSIVEVLHSIGCPNEFESVCMKSEEHHDDIIYMHFNGKLGNPLQFDNVCWFHASRLTENNTIFTDGLLALSQIKPQIWEHLRSLCRDVVDSSTWEELVIKAECELRIRGKTFEVAEGPFAFLINEPLQMYATSRGGNRDYFKGSELVEDICLGIGGTVGDYILDKYFKSTTPAVVKFIAPFKGYGVHTALSYLWARHWDKDLIGKSSYNTCFDGEGKSIPPEEIREIVFLK